MIGTEILKIDAPQAELFPKVQFLMNPSVYYIYIILKYCFPAGSCADGISNVSSIYNPHFNYAIVVDRSWLLRCGYVVDEGGIMYPKCKNCKN